MADREEEEDLQMALRMSLQGSLPEPKRSKPFEEESQEAREKRLQRELRAAAAERRISMLRKSAATTATAVAATSPAPVEDRSRRSIGKAENSGFDGGRSVSLGDGEVNQADEKRERRDGGLGEELSPEVANQLFSMMFGNDVSTSILSQWTNQGIRFSSDPDTCIGLVQHEGGPCGVLAAIQAFVLKYLLFSPQNLNTNTDTSEVTFSQRRFLQNPKDVFDSFTRISEDQKSRALICSMVEILFSCGSKKRVAIATLNIFGDYSPVESEDNRKDKVLSEALEGFSIQSAADLQKTLRVTLYTSEASAFRQLMMDIPVFHSRMGAILFLISALLSRGLDFVQTDRDDPSLPLVTAPFGHASQEIVNLLLCGRAAPNVFDDNMDLGGGMFLKGIPGNVEVGFLTLLESLNFCKVGRYLKCPKWPIWVVGSESHYTVLFALDTSVQNENELEERESKIRRTFNNEDQSGGGGFISVEGFHKVLRETGIRLPQDKFVNLCGAGYIVWNDFWHVLLDLDKNLGGLKDVNGLGKKEFVIYHFNGIAKSVSNGSQISSTETLIQRPRLCKLNVSVPPRWTQEEFMADVNTSNNELQGKDGNSTETIRLPEQPQQAPLVDCIRTRWPRAACQWFGDPPSIV